MLALSGGLEVSTAHPRAAVVERRIVRTAFQPPPRLTVTEWADTFRYLSPESSAEPGKFNSSRAPYQREPMNALSDRRVERVVLMWPSQVGKTEIGNNFVGQRIHMRPGPMLMMQPNVTPMAEAWSKDRLTPMVRDTPVLNGKVRDARARDSGNTILHKSFPGGQITVVGANSPAGLASRPIRDVICDEVDRYPVSAGTEGDPIGLVFRRQSTFSDKKQLLISSPTIKGASRIEAEYADSTQEKWQVPCPHCSELQILEWGGTETTHGIRWDSGRPETAYYCCRHCDAVIEEKWKGWMNARGAWVAENPGHRTRGFWTNALISPWSKWADLVREFLQVKSDPIRLRQFVNTVLCETWEDEGARLDAHVLMSRLEQYPTDDDGTERAPARVAVVTAAVDVQDDRLEVAWWGWGEGEEGWLLRVELIPGDPGTAAPWNTLDAMLMRKVPHASGAELPVSVTCIDSGGHHTKAVYAFTRARVGRRVFAIKGSSLEGHPLLGRPSRSNAAKAILYMVGSFTGKETVVSRFAKVREHGPGYLHLPSWLDAEQLHQFTNEKLLTKIVGGRAKRLWLKTGRNEQLDLLVYALAALQVLGPGIVKRLGSMADQLAAAENSKREAESSPGQSIAIPPKPPRARRGWVGDW
jgi:phage terminase large subunit GpA-like protein